MGITPSSDLDDEMATQWRINSSEFVLEKLVGSNAFFQLYVDVDDKNSSVNVLKVNTSIYNIQNATGIITYCVQSKTGLISSYKLPLLVYFLDCLVICCVAI